MSSNVAVAARAVSTTQNGERAHRIRLIAGYVLAIVLLLSLAIYGFDYYTLDISERPFSPKHHLLRPSGTIGLKLGFLGMFVFFAIFLYPLRKHWAWLGRQGLSRRWLDIHILFGLSAPFIIAFHSAFKFRGFAGIAFWIMVAVSASGIVGRYLYGQIPRSLNQAELSLKNIQEIQGQLAAQLTQQRILPQADLREFLRLPSPEQARRLFVPVAIVYMMILDVSRFFGVARLRRRALSGSEYLSTLFGFFRSNNPQLERAISSAAEGAALSKRILFLSRSQKVFHLWHVVHKPFSYAFAMLALIHIATVMLMGYGLR